MWDLRRLIGWLRRQGAPAIGVHGVSLGGYTAALLAALEPDLERVVLGIPGRVPDRSRARQRAARIWCAPRSGWDSRSPQIEETLKVVSPLAMPARVAKERRFIYAGTADQLAPPEHAFRLWNHWDRPQVLWYQGGHISFLMEPTREEAAARSAECARDARLGAGCGAGTEQAERTGSRCDSENVEAPRDFSLALAAQS